MKPETQPCGFLEGNCVVKGQHIAHFVERRTIIADRRLAAHAPQQWIPVSDLPEKPVGSSHHGQWCDCDSCRYLRGLDPLPAPPVPDTPCQAVDWENSRCGHPRPAAPRVPQGEEKQP